MQTIAAVSITNDELTSWSELGSVDAPREFTVPNVGIIHVMQRDIADAKLLGGNPRFELTDVTSAGDRMPSYRIGRFIP